MLNITQRQLSSSAGLSAQKENKIDDRKNTVSPTNITSSELVRWIGSRMIIFDISLFKLLFHLIFLSYLFF